MAASDTKILLPHWRRWRWFSTATVALLAMVMTAGVWRQTRDSAIDNARSLFSLRVDELAAALAARDADFEQVLRAARGLLAADRAVDVREWQTYVQALNIGSHNVGIGCLAVLDVVPAAERDRFAAAQKPGRPDFEIRARGGRDPLVIARLVEPARPPCGGVAGQDVADDPARAEALDRARDSALPTATALLRPFGSPAIAADSIAIYVPVYRAGQPLSTPEDRRRALSSFVAATVHIGSMVEGALAGLRPGGGASPILFSLEDVTDPDPRLIFDGGLPDRERGAGAGHGMRKTVVIDISGRQWMVTAVPAVAADPGGFGVEIPLLWTGAVAVFGLMLTGLTYAFGIILENRASLRRAIASLAQREEELDRLAHSDPLTGLANRRHFFLLGLAEWSRVKRHGRALSVLMMDIDHFKAINDSHGHDVGDECLKAFAAGCRVVLRDCDLVARMGGEEFAVLLSEIALPEARLVAERLRLKTADLRVPLASGGDVRLTVSIGIAAVTYQDQSLEDVVRRADHALYSAKEAGRDRVVAFDFGDQHLFALSPVADSHPAGVAAASSPSSSPSSSAPSTAAGQ